MVVPYSHESVRLTGRWDTSSPECAITVAPGSYLEFSFEGKHAVARFDIEANMLPLLHLWVQVDGGVMTEAQIDRYLRVNTLTEGVHVCRIIYKGGTENSNRWFAPLRGKVTFLGVQTEKPIALPADNRPIVEFVGDSITEGVLIDVDYHEGTVPPFELDQLNRAYHDDACATYAWLTAEKLDLRPVIMGFGATGVTKAGISRVPAAQDAYPFNFDGSPVTRPQPDYVVINHGANDRRVAAELYVEKYAILLDVVRKYSPNAKIAALSAFCGAHKEALRKMVEDYNQKNGTDVQYINGGDWISPEPLHPLRDGHITVANHLSAELKRIWKL